MGNSDFEYIKNSDKYFKPKTPFAALKAVEAGLLPPEAYIYKSTSIEPIADNPENLEEIERILGQRNRDLATNILLKSILDKLVRNPDKEVALFAAESLNSIENDYNRAVENLKEGEDRKRAELYMELAELNKDVEDLGNFYLRESFRSYINLQKKNEAETEDLLNMCRILISLGLPQQAAKTIEDNNIKCIEAKFILADIAFRQRDYIRINSLMAELDKHLSEMDYNQTALLDFWMDKE